MPPIHIRPPERGCVGVQPPQPAHREGRQNFTVIDNVSLLRLMLRTQRAPQQRLDSPDQTNRIRNTPTPGKRLDAPLPALQSAVQHFAEYANSRMEIAAVIHSKSP